MAEPDEKKALNFHQMDLDDRILKVNIVGNITSTLIIILRIEYKNGFNKYIFLIRQLLNWAG